MVKKSTDLDKWAGETEERRKNGEESQGKKRRRRRRDWSGRVGNEEK